jgi:hypothetical protein
VDVARTLLSLAGVPVPESGMGGRDLTDLESESHGALGMRKTFASDPPEDLRLDGHRHRLPRYLFYAVDRDGRVFRGNGSAMTLESPATDSANIWSELDLLRLFKGLETQLEASASSADTSPEVERALEALGYIR